MTRKSDLPPFSTLIMDEIYNLGQNVNRRSGFMGLDIRLLQENFKKLKNIRLNISENEKPKPYANMEIRIWNPPTTALKTMVDLAYPLRMLTHDKMFVKNLKGA